ncbi:MAG: methylenetetrahydrofolate--tRNA-(uracil(54)-C(5))-methyltransferase (FADH(2)-oxidizing) TrmFO [Ruminiclostridium sp.]|nr:methylenetetrahydrofolate--tRNA-(uracil(54)-C(5))-methyltransferase (FADH(2)-oxidizing) TrmFO [Ruminiclostridium sp.]
MKIKVIGADLAGCEAAWRIANSGYEVELYEMKPEKYTPAHHYKGFAELVCSNSLKASRIESAAGMLKEEMRLLGSLVMEAANATSVEAGGALAVNRTDFSDYITEKITNHPIITVISGEVTEFPDENTIIATGPLTSDTFADKIYTKLGKALSFYDAAAPIVTAESLDMTKAFFASRYDRGDADYINCPFTKEEYEAFYEELIKAETAPLKEFEDLTVYEGCMPVEVLAKRGIDSVRYGCMKPVGLTDPRTGRRPYAAVQLRKENKEGTLYNIVGFQTNLKFGEQKRVFSMIPGLENAEFMRYGVMHRNTFLNSPELLNEQFMLKGSKNIFFAGQMTGVEGYTESAYSGILAAMHLLRNIEGKPLLSLPLTSMGGALSRHISTETKNFQPMGAHMGILPTIPERIKDKQDKYAVIAERGLNDFKLVMSEELR